MRHDRCRPQRGGGGHPVRHDRRGARQGACRALGRRARRGDRSRGGRVGPGGLDIARLAAHAGVVVAGVLDPARRHRPAGRARGTRGAGDRLHIRSHLAPHVVRDRSRLHRHARLDRSAGARRQPRPRRRHRHRRGAWIPPRLGFGPRRLLGHRHRVRVLVDHEWFGVSRWHRVERPADHAAVRADLRRLPGPRHSRPGDASPRAAFGGAAGGDQRFV